MNGLLLTLSSESAKLLLQYGIYAAIILVGILCIMLVKRKTKNELKAECVKKRCAKAKKYAFSVLKKDRKSSHLVLASTKLLKLNNYVANAAWSAYQIADVKKDIVFEGIADSLNTLAITLMKESEDGYIPYTELEAEVNAAIKDLDTIVAKIDDVVSKR